MGEALAAAPYFIPDEVVEAGDFVTPLIDSAMSLQSGEYMEAASSASQVLLSKFKLFRLGKSAVPSKQQIMAGLSALVVDGAINLSALEALIPNSGKDSINLFNKQQGSYDLPAGQKYIFKVGKTRIELKFHSPQLSLRKSRPTSNSARVWTAQIKVQKHMLLTNGTWSARKGISKSNRAHIPLNRSN